MADLDHEHVQLLAFDVSDNSIIPYAIPPVAVLPAAQRFSEMRRVIRFCDAFVQITDNLNLRLTVELPQGDAGRVGKTIGPIHASHRPTNGPAPCPTRFAPSRLRLPGHRPHLAINPARLP